MGGQQVGTLRYQMTPSTRKEIGLILRAWPASAPAPQERPFTAEDVEAASDDCRQRGESWAPRRTGDDEADRAAFETQKRWFTRANMLAAYASLLRASAGSAEEK